MRTYFEHSKKERSEMSEEVLKSFIDSELMLVGVLNVQPPIYKNIDKTPEIKKERWFKAGDYYFSTMEQAQAFIDLGPMRSDYDYGVSSSDLRYLTPLYSNAIEPVDMINKSEYYRVADDLKKIKEDENHNKNLKSEYNEARKPIEKIIDALYDDWRDCLELSWKHKQIKKTYEEYLDICEGKQDQALKFLEKVYSEKDINDCGNWFLINDLIYPEMASDDQAE